MNNLIINLESRRTLAIQEISSMYVIDPCAMCRTPFDLIASHSIRTCGGSTRTSARNQRPLNPKRKTKTKESREHER